MLSVLLLDYQTKEVHLISRSEAVLRRASAPIAIRHPLRLSERPLPLLFVRSSVGLRRT
jgi:hypothetical protein